MDRHLIDAVDSVPAGGWAVGVSGGADSVALLSLLRPRTDLHLHVVHLDHQMRGAESAGDAAFVAALSKKWALDCTVATRDSIEPGMAHLPANVSARFRAIRLALFARIVAERGAQGVLLAHHADDQAETVLQRLLRGSGGEGLGGMAAVTRVKGLCIRRPLLRLRRDVLRDWLRSTGQPWREDSSNASVEYARNRLRSFLAARPMLVEDLLLLGEACAALRDWVEMAAPVLGDEFHVDDLRNAAPLARAAARRWLAGHGSPREELTPAAVGRLITMAADAASPPRVEFPGAVRVWRRRGKIFVQPRPPVIPLQSDGD